MRNTKNKFQLHFFLFFVECWTSSKILFWILALRTKQTLWNLTLETCPAKKININKKKINNYLFM